MIPILYPAAERDYNSNGLGMLTDTISCTVQQELNGQYELTLKYPAKGLHAEEIKDRCIIVSKADPVSEPQPFRIYRINPVSAGTITVYARHIAYDMAGIILGPMSANSPSGAFEAIQEAATTACPYTFWTDRGGTAEMRYPRPRSLWRTLGGSEKSILDTYGGEYEFDRYKVKLHTHRGTNRGVEIRYGKNLRTLEMDRNCAEIYTGIYPYWYSEQDGLVELPEKILKATGEYGFERIAELDLSGEWTDRPSEADLRIKAQNWMTANHIGVPKISWKIEFLQLEQTEEYRGRALLERVLLGDDIHIIFPGMGVDATARAVNIEYDPITERYNSVTLGRVHSNLADTIVQQGQAIARKPSMTLIQQISKHLADSMGVHGGAVRLLDTNGDGNPDELYIADSPDPNRAVKVWRFNHLGWAASRQGYSGPWIMGATLEDGLMAEAITAGTLTATNISIDGKFSVRAGEKYGGNLGYLAGIGDAGQTNGIGMTGPSPDIYAIATEEGVALRAGAGIMYIVTDSSGKGRVKIIGDVEVSGSVIANDPNMYTTTKMCSGTYPMKHALPFSPRFAIVLGWGTGERRAVSFVYPGEGATITNLGNLGAKTNWKMGIEGNGIYIDSAGGDLAGVHNIPNKWEKIIAFR